MRERLISMADFLSGILHPDGEIPLFSDIRISGDKGVPIVIAEPDSIPSQAFIHCAESVLKQLK